jgi:diaminohydroxyphosphoribosylaminopyrimidine deaminase/5-amino-6-(5-phosphoribosylamino)uracil reductase
MNELDRHYAQLALEAAAEGIGQACPNPIVGTVVVRDGKVVGRGAHVYDNRKHAEVVALEDAGELARGATVYVNLEPCSHHGRTPPCVDALIEAGVSRVVASMQDPAPYVNGRGFELLREAGIEVEVGVEREAAERLNERYIKFMTTGRPFVLLKVAETLDGRVATRTGASKWITGEAARAASQELRRAYDAIVVGVNTVVCDDPILSYRGEAPKRVPLVRAVLDPKLRIPLGSRLVASAGDAPLVVYTRETADEGPRRAAAELRARGAEVVELPVTSAGSLDLSAMLLDLGGRRLHGLIVEGGPETSAAFVKARAVDKAVFYVAPTILGGRDSRGSIGGEGTDTLDGALRLERLEVRRVGEDLEVAGYPVASE